MNVFWPTFRLLFLYWYINVFIIVLFDGRDIHKQNTLQKIQKAGNGEFIFWESLYSDVFKIRFGVWSFEYVLRIIRYNRSKKLFFCLCSLLSICSFLCWFHVLNACKLHDRFCRCRCTRCCKNIKKKNTFINWKIFYTEKTFDFRYCIENKTWLFSRGFLSMK